MLYKTLSAAVYGVDVNIIEVEVEVSGIKTNQDHFHTVGLPDAAVREIRDRVRSALRNCGYDSPLTHISVKLAPADIRKEGSSFDLPMALAILGAYGGLTKKELPDCVFVGELSLGGGIRGVRVALPVAMETRGKKLKRFVVPEVNARRYGQRRRSLPGAFPVGRDSVRQYRDCPRCRSAPMSCWPMASTLSWTSGMGKANKPPTRTRSRMCARA